MFHFNEISKKIVLQKWNFLECLICFF
jgi:hypothetical protein